MTNFNSYFDITRGYQKHGPAPIEPPPGGHAVEVGHIAMSQCCIAIFAVEVGHIRGSIRLRTPVDPCCVLPKTIRIQIRSNQTAGEPSKTVVHWVPAGDKDEKCSFLGQVDPADVIASAMLHGIRHQININDGICGKPCPK